LAEAVEQGRAVGLEFVNMRKRERITDKDSRMDSKCTKSSLTPFLPQYTIAVAILIFLRVSSGNSQSWLTASTHKRKKTSNLKIHRLISKTSRFFQKILKPASY
jgi:hypothetical protein